MIQFFAPDIARTLTLPESDSQHCVRVLRMQPGDMLEVTDGAGHRHRCRLVDAHQKRALVEIVSTETILPGWSQEITVCVAPTKHMDRMEWMVEKLTEIGESYRACSVPPLGAQGDKSGASGKNRDLSHEAITESTAPADISHDTG